MGKATLGFAGGPAIAFRVDPVNVIGVPECYLPECEDPVLCRKMCSKHYQRWKRHGDPLAVLPMGPRPNYDLDSYGAQHHHVRVARGTPSYCEHCHSTDPDKWYEWAFNHVGDRRNVQDYLRLCRSCHRKFDETPEKLEQLALARASGRG